MSLRPILNDDQSYNSESCQENSFERRNLRVKSDLVLILSNPSTTFVTN